jgi:hypothetical protein
MGSDLCFAQLVLLALRWLCLLLQWAWPSARAPAPPTRPRRTRRREPTPCAGLTTKPHCDACVRASAPRPQAPSAPPPRLGMTRGRRRAVDPAGHFCPTPAWAYRGGVGWGTLRANGPPNGGPWRQLRCVAGRRSFLETLGTLLHGKRTSPDLSVQVSACVAEGLGSRGTARVFEVDPHTVPQWWVEAADQLQASSGYFLRTLQRRQVQRDALYAVLRAVKEGEVSAAEAIAWLSRSPHWVWGAMDPESKLLLRTCVGERTLAMAQYVVQQVAQL